MISTHAILDSGADGSMLPSDFAAPLGISIIDDCHKDICKGVAGGHEAHKYPGDIVAHVLGERIPLTGAFSDGLDVVLLGRRDFFDWYRVTFDQRAKTFTLDPYEERPHLEPPMRGP